jgi:hypothetical protein
MLIPPADLSPASVLASIPPSSSKPHYLIFFSTPEPRGRMWCRHCLQAEPVIKKDIKELDCTVVFVGGPEEWMDKENNIVRLSLSLESRPELMDHGGSGEKLPSQ